MPVAGRAPIQACALSPDPASGKVRPVMRGLPSAARAMVEYTWAKLWNAKAFNACSGMPRFGHGGLLNEKQLQDLMALLLDPKSPVNQ